VRGRSPALPGPNGFQHGSTCPLSYCISKTTGDIALCTSAHGVPEQVNIQIAGPDAVVVQWVTFKAVPPVNPPIVQIDGWESPVVHLAPLSLGRHTYVVQQAAVLTLCTLCALKVSCTSC
jgi:hypothetical protein